VLLTILGIGDETGDRTSDGTVGDEIGDKINDDGALNPSYSSRLTNSMDCRDNSFIVLLSLALLLSMDEVLL